MLVWCVRSCLKANKSILPICSVNYSYQNMAISKQHFSTEIPIIKDLDLSRAPNGTISRYWVHVVSSGTAQPILVPVMVARGSEDGPVLGLTAAVHGNELN